MVQTLKQFAEQEQENDKEAKVDQEVSNEQQVDTQSAEGKEAVKESVVIIDGKERPLKNYEAELKRKHDEETESLRRELEEARTASHSSPNNQQSQQTNWFDHVYQMAENEIATTGKAVPIRTVMEVANAISRRNLESELQSREQADKAIKQFKKSVREDPTFKDIEDDFDDLVGQLKKDQINLPTLEVILNAAKGKKLNDLLKKAQDKAKSEAVKDSEIIGSPVSSQTGGTRKATSLSADQKAELERLNNNGSMNWTEDEYLRVLKNKQDRFKSMGARNVPLLHSDNPIR